MSVLQVVGPNLGPLFSHPNPELMNTSDDGLMGPNLSLRAVPEVLNDI